jgi:beta-lactamase class C
MLHPGIRRQGIARLVPLLLAGLLSLPAAAADYTAATDARLREFEEYFVANILPHVPGAALAIVADGRVELIKPYGVRRAGSAQPVTTDTVFRLASVSKSFASTATGLLVRDKLLDWDTKVNSQLEYLRFKNSNYGSQITVRNLLSHTTGLVQHAYTDLLEGNVPYNEIIGRLKNVDFICPPGTCYSYQNVVFSLTGDLIQSVSGKPYEEFVRDNLFRPLGMRTASIGMLSFNSTQDRATPHVWRNARWQPVNVRVNYYNVAPAAGINASINDMKQWLLAQMGKRPDVLPTPILNELQSPAIPTTAYQAHYRSRKELGEVGYGLGWRVFDYGGSKHFVHHGGYVQGMISEIVFNRELQLGMVFLTNSEISKAQELVFTFLEIYQRPAQSRNNNIGTRDAVHLDQVASSGY